MGLFDFFRKKKSDEASEETISASPSTTNQAEAPSPASNKQDLMRQLGRASVDLFKSDDNADAVAQLQAIEDAGLAEAAISLGQLYQMKDQSEALKHFRIAADAGIAEGEWSVAAILGHEYQADIEGKDAEWYKYCVRAAKGGCADAMNELGKVYNRKNEYLSAFYWLLLAIYYEHPVASTDFDELVERYKKLKPEDRHYSQVPEITPEESKSAELVFKVVTGELRLAQEHVDAMVKRAMSFNSEICALFIAHLFEGRNDESEKMAYQIAANSGSIMGMKCLGDMLAYGKGCVRDMGKAFSWYQGAAEAYEKTACFIWSQAFMKKSDFSMAAYWATASYRRGYQPALNLLLNIGRYVPQ